MNARVQTTVLERWQALGIGPLQDGFFGWPLLAWRRGPARA